jgi:hypothetical protein
VIWKRSWDARGPAPHWHEGCEDEGRRQVTQAVDRISDMIEFDVQCRLCRTPMTLQVRDERARAAFEKDGALCDVCYELAYRARATTDAAPSTSSATGHPAPAPIGSLRREPGAEG